MLTLPDNQLSALQLRVIAVDVLFCNSGIAYNSKMWKSILAPCVLFAAASASAEPRASMKVVESTECTPVDKCTDQSCLNHDFAACQRTMGTDESMKVVYKVTGLESTCGAAMNQAYATDLVTGLGVYTVETVTVTSPNVLGAGLALDLGTGCETPVTANPLVPPVDAETATFAPLSLQPSNGQSIIVTSTDASIEGMTAELQYSDVFTGTKGESEVTVPEQTQETEATIGGAASSTLTLCGAAIASSLLSL